MSKNAQRRVSAYAQGKLDARDGFYRGRKHPFLYEYNNGFRDGLKSRPKSHEIGLAPLNIWDRLLIWFLSKWRAHEAN